ncbi:MAG: HAMP domain-containing histidine kinase [Brevinematales bacterium]|nr:HAMP domain-containing histidine kinase [Brevinematales bacterium]
MKNKVLFFSISYFIIFETIYYFKFSLSKQTSNFFIFFSIINFITFITINLISYLIITHYNKKIKKIESIINGREKISLSEKDPDILKFENFCEKLNQNDIFKHIVNLISENILILKNEKIIYANNIFKEKFEKSPENKKFWELIPEKRLIDFLNSEEKVIIFKILARDYTIIKEIYNDNVILYLKDITEIANLENKKREFISYFSHEVRTPMTVMKGYLETILEETSLKNTKEYTKIILKHTDNLIKLLTELLRLSELESEAPRLIKENFLLFPLIEDTKNLFLKKMQDKNIEFELNCPPDLIIYADKFAISIVLNNLFDNAIKHTSNGKIKIEVEQSNSIIINFEDTGEGIKDEDLPFIFDTFYVGDKGRTKEKSGFGLGLAIVKKLILLHNGTIDVRSKYHFGTKFIIKLPTK